MKLQPVILFLAMFMLFLQGCLSQIAPVSKAAPTWIGSPIKDMQNVMSRPGSYASRIGWKQKTYKLDNGNWVFVEPVYPTCFVHWEINPEGIIVNYKTEGKGCD